MWVRKRGGLSPRQFVTSASWHSFCAQIRNQPGVKVHKLFSLRDSFPGHRVQFSSHTARQRLVSHSQFCAEDRKNGRETGGQTLAVPRGYSQHARCEVIDTSPRGSHIEARSQPAMPTDVCARASPLSLSLCAARAIGE